jgi:electron transport complex protein RnfB
MNENEIDALLPQTQCAECGFAGCKPYATALVNNEAEINLCPPGGLETLRALASALGKASYPFEEEVIQNTRTPSIAEIKEADCIGCTKCIQACPVDAIMGTNKHMHTVISHECTGCGLCVEPCPVDCIEMIEQEKPAFDKNLSRTRFDNRKARLLKEEEEKRAHYQRTRNRHEENDTRSKQDYIKALLKRKKGSTPTLNTPSSS